MGHPLREALDAAARGSFPPVDGRIEVVPPAGGPCDVIVGFTGHIVLAAAVDEAAVHERMQPWDFSVPFSAAFLEWLGGQLGAVPTSQDAVFAAPGTGAGCPDWLHETDARTHPRIIAAGSHRVDLRAFVTDDGDAVMALGRGVCGRWEVGYEVAPGARGRGLGRRLVAAARGLIGPDERLWAQVAPGNAASMRSTMAGGFVPIASEVLFPRAR